MAARVIELLEERPPDAFPRAVGLPLRKTPPAGDGAAIGGRQVVPAAASAQDVEDAIQRAAVVGARAARAAGEWQERAHALPLGIGERGGGGARLTRADRVGHGAPDGDEGLIGFVEMLNRHLVQQISLARHDEGFLPARPGERAEAGEIAPNRNDDALVWMRARGAAQMDGETPRR